MDTLTLKKSGDNMKNTCLLGLLLALPLSGIAQDATLLVQQRCAACHLAPDPLTDAHTPDLEAMAGFTPNAVYNALVAGPMQIQAAGLDDEQLRAVAEAITGRSVSDTVLAMTTGLCQQPPVISMPAAGDWNGWGPDTRNTRFNAGAGVSAEDLGSLELLWAFGLPDEGQARGQPVVIGDMLFVGNSAGALYALDAESGCTHWSFLPRAGIRSAATLGESFNAEGEKVPAVFFVDAKANVYAVDARSGSQLWVRRVEDHPAVRGTGSLTLYDGVLYVPMTGVSEESAASGAGYPCCTFRGSLTALSAADGSELWRYFTVPESQPRGTNSSGVALYGPAGAGIWSAPTIDPGRGLVYVATGNAYAEPAPETSDAVVAIDMASGQQVWVKQLLPGDAWIGGCQAGSDNANCPTDIGPDFDFSASPALATTADGRDLLVVPQKSGVIYALDPDEAGRLIWEHRAGPGSAVGGVWGTAVTADMAYVAVGGYFAQVTGGIHGLDLATGEALWQAPAIAAAELFCDGGQGCGATQSAAVTAIPGAVFSGAQDGGMRAYSAASGEILWQFNANRVFTTVNGVPAKGGSFDGAGPVVADGRVYMLTGNAGFVGMPGNVLLVFGVPAK